MSQRRTQMFYRWQSSVCSDFASQHSYRKTASQFSSLKGRGIPVQSRSHETLDVMSKGCPMADTLVHPTQRAMRVTENRPAKITRGHVDDTDSPSSQSNMQNRHNDVGLRKTTRFTITLCVPTKHRPLPQSSNSLYQQQSYYASESSRSLRPFNFYVPLKQVKVPPIKLSNYKPDRGC